MILYMMVGIPGSGKSTWVQRFLEHKGDAEYVLIGSDYYIEQKAKEEGKTYDQVWSKYAKEAEKAVVEQIKFAVSANANIIWDQTNLTKKVRAKRLALFPDHYSKYWCFHETPDSEELAKRLDRPGKTIPDTVLENMKGMLEVPSIDEGFNGFVR